MKIAKEYTKYVRTSTTTIKSCTHDIKTQLQFVLNGSEKQKEKKKKREEITGKTLYNQPKKTKIYSSKR